MMGRLGLVLSLLVLTSCASPAAYSSSGEVAWKTERADNGVVATHSELKGLKVPLIQSGGEVRVKEWKPSPTNKDIWILVYDSGAAGTQHIYQIDRAVIVDKKNKKVLGDAPLFYHPVGDAPEQPQPEWKWSKDQLVVKDLAYDEGIRLLFDARRVNKSSGSE